jgi:hypothetical protein
MKRILSVVLLMVALASGGDAAVKSYQFTGVVKAVDAASMTVEKSAKESWQFELGKDTKGGAAKVGDKVTVYYKMVATEIESKPATPTPTKTKK